MEIVDGLRNNQHGLQLAAQHVNVTNHKGDIEQREEIVDKLEQNQFGYAVPLKLRLSAVIFWEINRNFHALLGYLGKLTPTGQKTGEFLEIHANHHHQNGVNDTGEHHHVIVRSFRLFDVVFRPN